MVVEYEKISVFDQYLASSRVVNGATVSCCKQSAVGPLMTLITGGTEKAFVDRGTQTTKHITHQ